MSDEQNIFDEVEHWLAFMREWQIENDEPVPELVLDCLENALKKNVYEYRYRNELMGPVKNSDKSMH